MPNTYIRCNYCTGAGRIRHVERCSDCNGNDKKCSTCNGTGTEVTSEFCYECDGKGGRWDNSNPD